MSKGYEQFKRVDRELDALLLYLEKLEEDYAEAKNKLNNQIGYTARYKNGFEMESGIKLCIISLLISLETCLIS